NRSIPYVQISTDGSSHVSRPDVLSTVWIDTQKLVTRLWPVSTTGPNQLLKVLEKTILAMAALSESSILDFRTHSVGDSSGSLGSEAAIFSRIESLIRSHRPEFPERRSHKVCPLMLLPTV